MTNTVEQAVRQAGVIYVKNMIGSQWALRDVEATPAAISSGQVLTFAFISRYLILVLELILMLLKYLKMMTGQVENRGWSKFLSRFVKSLQAPWVRILLCIDKDCMIFCLFIIYCDAVFKGTVLPRIFPCLGFVIKLFNYTV